MDIMFLFCVAYFVDISYFKWTNFSIILHNITSNQVVKLKAFTKFENTSEALSAATLLIDSKPSKGLRNFLRAHCEGETLAVADSKLGNAIKEKLVSQ